MTIPQYCWIQLSTMAHADSSFHDLSKKDWYLQFQSMIMVCFALKGQLWGIRYTPVLVVDKPKGWQWLVLVQVTTSWSFWGYTSRVNNNIRGNHDFHMNGCNVNMINMDTGYSWVFVFWSMAISNRSRFTILKDVIIFLGIFSLHHLISLKGPGEGKWIVNVHATTGEWSARAGRTFQFFYALSGFGWHHTTERTPSRANGTEQYLKSQSTVRCEEWKSGPLTTAHCAKSLRASWAKSCSLNIKAIWGKPATNKPLVYVFFRPP